MHNILIRGLSMTAFVGHSPLSRLVTFYFFKNSIIIQIINIVKNCRQLRRDLMRYFVLPPTRLFWIFTGTTDDFSGTVFICRLFLLSNQCLLRLPMLTLPQHWTLWQQWYPPPCSLRCYRTRIIIYLIHSTPTKCSQFPACITGY